MKRIAASLLLLVSILTWSSFAAAMPEHRSIGENQIEAKRAAKQYKKYSNKQAKRQRKQMKKYQKAQQKAAKRQQRQYRHR
jgi:esterase/lipase